ncbi:MULTISPECIES: MIP/aquaporin family protein [Methanosphaera]|jgi:glycerol uptake facilitator protein|uniref:AqpM2 n=2 Tax=Methanosphaera stadtmanae TaxID=2317 RepID=Q2NEY6_METST|nr:MULTISPECIES: MIP/aquaporin family protein [Methanosphaera]ABC57617.1 AqpM2 [Methanosphaera stadtmanae DSM 3091]MDO5821979.1 MIP/aquaporin family protein [Methanosphaera sp.]MEE0489870.1 MIP/aquaporin family protein [Methanosphaera stadtmanae]OEC91661.1 aquaporin [Methanosphaera sp. A6]RAP02706.1 aquaporin [Methanosphaera stadtmanae]
MTEFRKILSEVIGTYTLVFFGTLSVVVTLLIAQGVETTNIFNIGIGALGGVGDWLSIGFAFAMPLIAAIYAFARISGAHFNPAVTIGLWSIKKFPTKDVIPYIVSQIIGSLLATFTIVAILGKQASTIGVLGSVAPFGDVTLLGVFIAEFLGTFLLMYAIMAVAVDKNAQPGFAALIIGLVILGIVVAIGNISGSGINPARSLTPMIGNLIVAGTPIDLLVLAVYIIAPILGAICGAQLYEYLYKEIGY